MHLDNSSQANKDMESIFNRAEQGSLEIIELMGAADRLNADGQKDQTITLYRLWLDRTVSPLAYVGYFNLGVILGGDRDFTQAEACYRKALELNPDFIRARLNLGNNLEQQGRDDEALEQWRIALTSESIVQAENLALQLHAYNNLGRLLEVKKDYQEALAMLEKSFSLDPTQRDVLLHLVHLVQKICRWPIFSPPKGISKKKMISGTSPLAMLAASDDPVLQLSAAQQFVEHKYSEANSEKLAPRLGYNHKKIRIGYLSSDFCLHAVSLLTVELLELHDHDQFEVYGFCWSREDGTSLQKRVVQAMDHHIKIGNMSDREAAECIRAHEIDIMVDLQGLTSGARPLILSYRPAPLQVTYLGFPGTTGLPWIDYVIADKYLIPDELVPFHTEKPIYMPECFQSSDSKRDVNQKPLRADNNLPEKAFVFCSFNNNYKFTPELFSTWISIMKRVPGSVFWLLADNEWAKENLIKTAKKMGVNKERLIFAPRVAPADYLARYQLADLFLDTFPFNGGTTANDALFMGLPLLTLSGRTFASRMAGSLLTHLGLPELITTSLKEYEERAVRLAKNPAELNDIKIRLKESKATSSVFDMPKFVKNYEAKLSEALKMCIPTIERKVHFVYAGPPNNIALHAPFSITRNVYNALSSKYTVEYHDWCSTHEIQYGPDDIIIGHPHHHPDTVIQKAMRNPNPCKAKILMFPLHTGRTEDCWPFNGLVERATAVFSICGPYWYDSIEATIFKSWKSKIVRFDMAVNCSDFPYLKHQINPAGKRRLLYLGSAIPNKNLEYLMKIMECLSYVELTWIGADMNHPLCSLPNVNAIGWQKLSAEAMKPFIDSHDFFISTSYSDANPTTILEAMAWGLIPICTKESGYWPDGEYMGEVVLSDFHKTINNIISFINMSEEQFSRVSTRNRQLVESKYNWKNFTDSVIQEIEKYQVEKLSPLVHCGVMPGTDSLKLFCVGHTKPIFESRINFTMLCPSPLGIRGEVVIEDNRFGPAVDGSSLAEYSQLFGLYELISAGDIVADNLFLFQYRKFLSPIMGGVDSRSPWVRIARPQEAHNLFPTLEQIESITSSIVVGSLFDLSESISDNYARVHVIEDLVMFAAACARSHYLTAEDVRSFVTFRGLIPSPGLCYVKTELFMNLMKILKDVCEEFLRDYHIKRDGYQRRVSGYLLERLHSYLLCKWLQGGAETSIPVWNRYVVTEN